MISVSAIAIYLITHLGVVGIAIGVFLNALGIPGLSEVLLPLAGVGVRQGRLDAVVLVIFAVLGQLAGASIAYVIARMGGVPLIERYGKYIFISKRELRSAQRSFDRYGGRTILLGSFTPGIQGFIGYVAGLAEMKFGSFLGSAAIGKIVWVSALVYLGWVLGHHLGLIDKVIADSGIAILLVLIIGIIWYVRKHRQYRLDLARAVERKPE